MTREETISQAVSSIKSGQDQVLNDQVGFAFDQGQAFQAAQGTPSPSGDGSVTYTQAQLDAQLAEAVAKAMADDAIVDAQALSDEHAKGVAAVADVKAQVGAQAQAAVSQLDAVLAAIKGLIPVPAAQPGAETPAGDGSAPETGPST